MGKQNHILPLSPVSQTVMGCGLKLRGLLLDIYAFFKQALLRFVAGPAAGGPVLGEACS